MRIFLLTVAIFAFQTPALPAFAHSGGLNAQGCHAGSQPYHCHRAQAPAAPVRRSGCHSSYEGQCVPIASDVDCGGGSGNGPEYVWGAVRVVGPDVYGLDRDNDGWGCE